MNTACRYIDCEFEHIKDTEIDKDVKHSDLDFFKDGKTKMAAASRYRQDTSRVLQHYNSRPTKACGCSHHKFNFSKDRLSTTVSSFRHDYQAELQATDTAFDVWSVEYQGVFDALLRECCGRFLLFHNHAQETSQDTQVDRLIDSVKWCRCIGYSHEEREIVIEQVKLEKPKIEEEVRKTTNQILQDVEQIQAAEFECSNTTSLKLEQLKTSSNGLLDMIRENDKDTGVLKDLEKNVQGIKRKVDYVQETHTKALQAFERDIEKTELKVTKDMDQILKRYEEDKQKYKGNTIFVSKLTEQLTKCENLAGLIKEKDKGSGKLEDLETRLWSLRQRLETELETQHNNIEEREKSSLALKQETSEEVTELWRQLNEEKSKNECTEASISRVCSLTDQCNTLLDRIKSDDRRSNLFKDVQDSLGTLMSSIKSEQKRQAKVCKERKARTEKVKYEAERELESISKAFNREMSDSKSRDITKLRLLETRCESLVIRIKDVDNSTQLLREIEGNVTEQKSLISEEMERQADTSRDQDIMTDAVDAAVRVEQVREESTSVSRNVLIEHNEAACSETRLGSAPSDSLDCKNLESEENMSFSTKGLIYSEVKPTLTRLNIIEAETDHTRGYSGVESVSNSASEVGRKGENLEQNKTSVKTTKAEVEMEKCKLEVETKERISQILETLRQTLESTGVEKGNNTSQELNSLSSDCDELLRMIRENDKGTGVLKDLEKNVNGVKRKVEDAKQTHVKRLQAFEKDIEKTELKVIKDMDQIVKRFEEDKQKYEGNTIFVSKLTEQLTKCENLAGLIEEKDKGSGKLEDLETRLWSLRQRLETELETQHNLIEEREKTSLALKQETSEEVSELRRQLNEEKFKDECTEASISRLSGLTAQCNTLLDRIKAENRQSGLLKDVLTNLGTLMSSVKSEEKRQAKVCKERKARTEKVKYEAERELESISKAFNREMSDSKSRDITKLRLLQTRCESLVIRIKDVDNSTQLLREIEGNVTEQKSLISEEMERQADTSCDSDNNDYAVATDVTLEQVHVDSTDGVWTEDLTRATEENPIESRLESGYIFYHKDTLQNNNTISDEALSFSTEVVPILDGAVTHLSHDVSETGRHLEPNNPGIRGEVQTLSPAETQLKKTLVETDINKETEKTIREQVEIEKWRLGVETEERISQILETLSQTLESTGVEKGNNTSEELNNLSSDCDEILRMIRENDKGTGVLKDLEKNVKGVKKKVDDAKQTHAKRLQAFESDIEKTKLKVTKDMDQIVKRFEEDKQKYEGNTFFVSKLTEQLTKCENLAGLIKEKDKGSGKLEDLETRLWSLRQRLETELETQYNLIEEREKTSLALKQETSEEVSELRRQLNEEKFKDECTEASISRLSGLTAQCNTLLDRIKAENRQSGLLKDVQTSLGTLMSSVKSEEKRQAKDCKERKARTEKVKYEAERELESISKAFNREMSDSKSRDITKLRFLQTRCESLVIRIKDVDNSTQLLREIEGNVTKQKSLISEEMERQADTSRDQDITTETYTTHPDVSVDNVYVEAREVSREEVLIQPMDEGGSQKGSDGSSGYIFYNMNRQEVHAPIPSNDLQSVRDSTTQLRLDISETETGFKPMCTEPKEDKDNVDKIINTEGGVEGKKDSSTMIKARVEMEKFSLEVETGEKISQILETLRQTLESTGVEKGNNTSEELNNLSSGCDELLRMIRENDKGTGVLKALEKNVKGVKRKVDDAKQTHAKRLQAFERDIEKTELKVTKDMDQIVKRFEEDKQKYEGNTIFVSKLTEQLTKCENLAGLIKEKDKGSGKLEDLETRLWSLRHRLETELETQYNLIEEREKTALALKQETCEELSELRRQLNEERSRDESTEASISRLSDLTDRCNTILGRLKLDQHKPGFFKDVQASLGILMSSVDSEKKRQVKVCKENRLRTARILEEVKLELESIKRDLKNETSSPNSADVRVPRLNQLSGRCETVVGRLKDIYTDAHVTRDVEQEVKDTQTFIDLAMEREKQQIKEATLETEFTGINIKPGRKAVRRKVNFQTEDETLSDVAGTDALYTVTDTKHEEVLNTASENLDTSCRDKTATSMDTPRTDIMNTVEAVMDIGGTDVLGATGLGLDTTRRSVLDTVQQDLDPASIDLLDIGKVDIDTTRHVVLNTAGDLNTARSDVLNTEKTGLDTTTFGDVLNTEKTGLDTTTLGDVLNTEKTGLDTATLGDVLNTEKTGLDTTTFGDVLNTEKTGLDTTTLGDVLNTEKTGLDTATLGDVLNTEKTGLDTATLGDVLNTEKTGLDTATLSGVLHSRRVDLGTGNQREDNLEKTSELQSNLQTNISQNADPRILPTESLGYSENSVTYKIRYVKESGQLISMNKQGSEDTIDGMEGKVSKGIDDIIEEFENVSRTKESCKVYISKLEELSTKCEMLDPELREADDGVGRLRYLEIRLNSLRQRLANERTIQQRIYEDRLRTTMGLKEEISVEMTDILSKFNEEKSNHECTDSSISRLTSLTGRCNRQLMRLRIHDRNTGVLEEEEEALLTLIDDIAEEREKQDKLQRQRKLKKKKEEENFDASHLSPLEARRMRLSPRVYNDYY